MPQADKGMEKRQQDQYNSIRQCFKTYDGRAFLWSMLEETGIHRISFVGEFPMTMAFNEGRRSIGTWAENWVFTIDPKVYIMMRQEAEERELIYSTLSKKAQEEEDND